MKSFTKPERDKRLAIRKEADNVLDWMRNEPPGTKEYQALAESHRALCESEKLQREAEEIVNKGKRGVAEATAGIIGAILVPVVLFTYEALGHVITTRAFNFKGRK